MSETYLRGSGLVERRREATAADRLTSGGGYVVTGEQLCTACLVGRWSMSMFRQSQTLCDTCKVLDGEVSRRSGLDRGSSAGRSPGGPLRLGGLDDPYDLDWEPIRQARAYREARLAQVFTRARGLGIVRLEERRPGQAPLEVIGYDDLRRHDLIPEDMPARVHRFAVWLRTLDPEGYRQRVDALAEVTSLGLVLVEVERARRRDRSRADLRAAVLDARRIPRALVSAAAGVLRSGRRSG